MRKFYLISLLLIAATISAFGQTVQIGTGTEISANTLYSPIYRYAATSTTTAAKSNIIYTQAELAAAGITTGVNITAIAFNKMNSANFVTPASTFKVYMANTSNTPPLATSTTWASIVASHTEVFSSTSYNIPLAAGWVTINITPFTYTGGSLEIATELQMTGNGGATDNFQWQYTTGFATSIIGVTGTGATLNGSVSGYKQRPNIQITYIPNTACTNPPTPGTATANNTGSVCPGSSVTLDVTGASIGSGLTFEWESSPTNTPFTPTSISSAAATASLMINPTTTKWYRAKVVCNNGTPVYSTPVEVVVAGGLPAGTYTIDDGAPTAGTNYNSFEDAIAALSCGIAGPVVFEVAPGSGPYVETINFGTVLNMNATNTITIKGNGATVQYTNTSSERQLLTLNGTKYLTIDSLVFKSLATSYGWGALITGGAAHDSIINCTFDLTSITSTTANNTSGICFSASDTDPNLNGANGSHCYIGNNHIKARTGSGGVYYAVTLCGTSDSNTIDNNILENFYMYGVYVNDATGSKILNNEIHRSTKTSVTTFYGIYTTGATPGTVIKGNRVHTPGGTVTGNTSAVYAIYPAGDGTAGNRSLVANNIVYDINQGGSIYGIYGNDMAQTDVYHNTVDISVPIANTSTSTVYGIYVSGTNNNTNVKNNIISITGGTGGTKYGFYYDETTSVADAQGNNFYVNSVQGGTQNYGYRTTAYADMASFQAAYPTWEVGSPNTDPQYTDASIGNFMPDNFMLYATGVNLNASVPTDINGTARIPTPTPGAYEMPMPPINNAATITLIEPSSSICPGSHPVSVSIMNAGMNTLNTVQLHWTVNNINQTPVSYTGPLSTPTAPSGQSMDTVLLGNVLVPASGLATVKVWTTMPNGVADTDNSNDTLTFTLTVAMNGTYTIDASITSSATNYQSFTDFTNDLMAKGICGPVVANVNPASGPYEETVSFGAITGSSAVNTIKINGNGATVEYSNTTSERQMLTLSGTQYLTIDSLTFKTLAATYGWGALITGGAAHDSIINCTFDLTSVTSTTANNTSGICFSSSTTDPNLNGANGSHCYIGNNYIQAGTGSGGPYYALTLCGASDSNVVANNIFENFYMYGIYINDATGSKILNNEVHRSTKTAVTTFYGIYTTAATPGTVIMGNKVHTPGGTVAGSTSTVYSIYSGGDGTATNRILVANNIVYDINQGGTIYGIYGTSAVETDILHNTIDLSVPIANTSTSTNYGIYVSGSNNNTNVKNNIVSITGGTGGTKYGFYYSASTSVNDAQGNNFYVNSTQGGTQNYGYYTSAYADLASFQTDYPALEVGSISEDPVFAVPGTSNLLPLNGNLFNYGTNQLTLVPTDITGISRATTPTPGAFELLSTFFNNAGAHELINPSGTFCSGPRTVEVAIINEAINELNDVEIHWTVNGVPQTMATYTGPLGGIYADGNIDTVTLGLADFPIGVASIVKVWTSMPNGNADSDNTNDTLTMTVEPSYSVVVNLGNDTTICEDESVTLNAGNPGAAYLWSDGSTAQTAQMNTAGLHYVTVTDADECIGTDTLELTVTPLPVIDLGNDTTICPGVVLTLDAGNPGATYLWDDASTAQTRDVSDETTYSVTVTKDGCSASDAITIHHIDLPSVDAINATYGDSATYTFYPLNPQFVSTYTWDFGDGSPQVTGTFVQHTYAQNGIYTVTLSLGSMCDGTFVNVSRTVDVFDATGGGTGINNRNENDEWTLYPNPAQDYVIVESKSGKPLQNAEVFTVTGQKVFETRDVTRQLKITTNGWTPGIYLLKMDTELGWIIRKFELVQ